MKPTEKELTTALNIVDILLKNNFLDAIISGDEDTFEEWCNNYCDILCDNNLEGHCGVSKVCITTEDLPDWVIKTGFISNDDGYDYCAIEADNYQSAIDAGLDEFFAADYELCAITPSEKYHFSRKVVFYIQQRADPDEEKVSLTCYNYMSGSDECDEDEDEYVSYDDYDRLESLFADSYKRLDKLFAFIKDWDINDLHTGNFGYTPKGLVKIIDYSGIRW